MRDLRLVRRIGGVPGRRLEHVALDNAGRDRVVVAEPDHRTFDDVPRGECAQRLQRARFTECRRQVEVAVEPDLRGYGCVYQLVDTRRADRGKHALGVRGAWADVPVGEGRADGRGSRHTRRCGLGDGRVAVVRHVSPEGWSEVKRVGKLSPSVLVPESLDASVKRLTPSVYARYSRVLRLQRCLGHTVRVPERFRGVLLLRRFGCGPPECGGRRTEILPCDVIGVMKVTSGTAYGATT